MNIPSSSQFSNIFGNGCGHNPLKPVFFTPPVDHKPRYYFIEKAKENAEKAYWYPRKWLCSLWRMGLRSERLEACIRLIQVTLHYTDMASLRLGIHNPQGMWLPTLEELSRYAGMGLRRTKRAMAEMVKAKYIIVEPRRVFRQGKFIGLAALRVVSEKLFEDLGICIDKLKKEQVKAKGRLNKLTKKIMNILSGSTGNKEKSRTLLSYLRDKPP